VIANVSGKSLKKAVDVDTFLPKFLEEERKPVKKSREQQRAEFAAFVGKHQELTKAARK